MEEFTFFIFFTVEQENKGYIINNVGNFVQGNTLEELVEYKNDKTFILLNFRDGERRMNFINSK